ncbi:stage II sporulation protein M [Anaerococcus sp. mt242]|uniref:stage II sporulation protein M n=2 Tax=Anaerococcus TaxID=165779 RepID=UPI001931B107|nr:stage II sporulation protein M [Anaerococcus sp. mt242]MBM0046169.1 stage II sporulation protein M [Anaerococcus sp. mt242]
MKGLMLSIKEGVSYYKNQFIFATVLYILTLFLGIIIFRNEKISIEPKIMGFWELLAHNSISAILIIVLGIFTFGIFGNFILISNSVVLGRVIIGVINQYGMSPIIEHILPHFVFETCALLLATALSYETFKFIYNVTHDDTKVIKLRYFFLGILIILFLLIIAALIESNIGVRI